MKSYIVVIGNYALSRSMYAFSTRELAKSFRDYVKKERRTEDVIHVFEIEVDAAVLKEEDM